ENQPFGADTEHQPDPYFLALLPPAGVAQGRAAATEDQLFETGQLTEVLQIPARHARHLIDLAADLARMLGDIETLYDAHARTAGEQVVGDVAVGVADGRDRTDAGDPNCRLMIHGFSPLRPRCARA